jgi:DNA-binding MarR family transcriptional regulator
MAASTQATEAELAHDLYSFMGYLLKAGSGDYFRTVAELDLTLTQLKALHILDAPGTEETLKSLAERLELSLPAVSRAVENLHQRGLVERHEDQADRRMKRVTATDAGRHATSTLHDARLSALKEFSATLTHPQRRRLAAALAPVLARPEVAACRSKDPR